jgi:hypothetical protein
MRGKKISIDKTKVKEHGIKLAKLVRNVSIAAVSMLILAAGAGVLYSWYMSNNSPEVETVILDKTPKKSSIIEPTKPADNAPVGAAVRTLTTPVTPGMNASVSVKTTPEVECTITVEYNKIPSTDSGLYQKISDEYGMVSWAWTVEDTVPLGTWPVKVTCALGERSAFVQGDLKVQASLSSEED